MGVSTSWNPPGLSSPVMELLYLFIFHTFALRKIQSWNSIWRSSSYRALNTLNLGYRNESVNAFTEMTSVCSEIRTKHLNGQKVEFLYAFAKLRKATVSFIMSVSPCVCVCVCLSLCSSAWNSATTRQIFTNFYIWVFFQNLCRKFKFLYNLTRMSVTSFTHQQMYYLLTWLKILNLH